MNIEEKIRTEVGYAVRNASVYGYAKGKWGGDISDRIEELINAQTSRILRVLEENTVGGPWTRHGHVIPGLTVEGPGRPNVARCGGPGLCPVCGVDAERARTKALDKS